MTSGDRAQDRQRLASIEEAIADVRQGRMLVVVDDEDRENEGDLVMAADRATPEAVNFMAKYGRGLVCVPLTGERLDELKISMMVADNTAPMGTAFTVTVDAKRGVTTGTSAYDRALTVRALVDSTTRPEDLLRGLAAPSQLTRAVKLKVGGSHTSSLCTSYHRPLALTTTRGQGHLRAPTSGLTLIRAELSWLVGSGVQEHQG